jgi:isoleucyl-tRNA synthetase
MSQVGENIRKYRNTARFMLGNLNNFKYNQLVEYEELDLVSNSFNGFKIIINN